MTRLENKLTTRELYNIGVEFVDRFIASYADEPEAIIFDCDDTNFNTHGTQEGGLFNDYYDEKCYMPLLIFEGISGKMILPLLRYGRRNKTTNITAILIRLIERMRHHWKNTQFLIRGDKQTGDKVMKKINIYIAFCVIFWLFYAAECSMEPNSYTIRVYNNSYHQIEVLLSLGNPVYPDTLLPDRFYDKLNSTKPGSARHFDNTLTYKNFIHSYGSDTIIIFIFHTDTLLKYSWDEVKEGYKILKRYDISWQEMEELEGRIHYPPTEAEKDIRQYPAYEFLE